MKSANLSTFADNPAKLIERTQRLQSEMLLWLSGQVKPQTQFDGTFKSLLESYERDPESSYQGRKPGVKETYGVYIRRLTDHIGALRIDHVDGRAVKRWFSEWRTAPDGSDHLPRARMVLEGGNIVWRRLPAAWLQSIPGRSVGADLRDRLVSNLCADGKADQGRARSRACRRRPASRVTLCTDL